ncbi:hypothetical protein DFH28DRAFT_925812 [Melampsora americana]|nr:hypothetical protein DFH28DRAFT_925812 [Melampsora americana]
MDVDSDPQRYTLFNRPLAPRHRRHERSVLDSPHNVRDVEEYHPLHSEVRCLQDEGKKRDFNINRLYQEVREHGTWTLEQIGNIATEQKDMDSRNRGTQRLITRLINNFDNLKNELEEKYERLGQENAQLAEAAYRTSVEESKDVGEQLQEAVRQQCRYTKQALTRLSEKTKVKVDEVLQAAREAQNQVYIKYEEVLQEQHKTEKILSNLTMEFELHAKNTKGDYFDICQLVIARAE